MITERRSLTFVIPCVLVAGLLWAAVPTAQTRSATLVVVLNEKTGSTLGIIDPVAGKIIARVPTGRDPHIVAASEDGTLAFVANTNGHGQTIPDGDSISVIDIAARKEIRRVHAGFGTSPLDIQAAGGKVYFSASGYKALGRYDPVRDKVDYFGLGQDGPSNFIVSKDLKAIFAVNPRSNSVSILENFVEGPILRYPAKPTDWKHTEVPVGKGPSGIAMSPDGKEVWTINEEEGAGSSIINVATRTVRTIELPTEHAVRLRFTPDGRRVLILDRAQQSGSGQIVVVDTATRKPIKQIRFTGDKSGERMSAGNLVVVPDGSRAYVTVNPLSGGGRNYIAVIDLKALTMSSRIEIGGDCRAGAVCGNGLAWAAPK